MIHSTTIELETQGNADMHDLTGQITRAVQESQITAGIVTVFCPSATSAVTTIEYESGALSDLKRLLDEIVPAHERYAHNTRWGDGNGHSHVRAALLGPSLTIPFVDSRLVLGTWQQVIYIDLDVRPRHRVIMLQLMGE